MEVREIEKWLNDNNNLSVSPPEHSIQLSKYKDKKGNLSVSGKKYRDKLLKHIAAYLLYSDNKDDFVYINKTDIANWMSYPTFATKGANDQIDFYYKSGRNTEGIALYEYSDKKCRINPNIINDFDISIIDESELKELAKDTDKSDYIIFKDTGSGVDSLEEIDPKEEVKHLN